MTCFMAFLSILLIAQAFAAPASNIGISNASKGSIAVGVVEGATFGSGAFSIEAEASNESSNDTSSPSCGDIKDFVSIFIKNVKC